MNGIHLQGVMEKFRSAREAVAFARTQPGTSLILRRTGPLEYGVTDEAMWNNLLAMGFEPVGWEIFQRHG